MTPVRERSRARAEQVLDREYDTLRADTLRGLRGKLATSGGASFDDTDLEAFYNQAWHGLYLRLAEGDEVDNHTGFLVNAAYFRAIEELRRVRPERRADAVDLAAIGTELDVDAQLDDHTQLTHFMEGMRDRLTERERQAATLCYIHGCTRPQTAEALGVSPKRMEKLMDGVSRKIGVLVADIRDGSWCESRDSLMKAYAFGVLDPDGERWQLASDHLRECPGCRRYVRGLRGVGALSPPIGLPMAALALLGGGAAGGAAAAGSAAGAGGSASGGAGGAAGGAASGGGGGLGATGAAVAATAVVAAAGLGVFTLVGRSDDKQQTPPAQRAVPTATTAQPPAAAAPAAKPKATSKKTKKKKAKQQAVTPATATPAAADSAAQQPAAQQPAPAAQQPAAEQPAPQAPEEQPTEDGAQEFGFEQDAP